ncbi:MAG: hypothetical protein NTY09_05300 [bacterium]|nr:hypothetical protein [bacterium]
MKNKFKNIPQSIDEWNGSYVKRIIPFIGVSIALHVVSIAIVFGVSFLYSGGHGLTITLFDPGQPGALNQQPPLVAGFDAPDRMKIFRIDFFREIIPWSPPPPVEPVIETPEVPEETPEVIEEPAPEEEVPEETVEQPTPEVVDENVAGSTSDEETSVISENELLVTDNPLSGTNTELIDSPDNIGTTISHYPINIDENEILPDSLVLYGGVTDSANVLLLPDWQLPGLQNLAWTNEYFLGNYTVYIVADISRRHGMEELLAWNYVLKMLVTNPQAAWPPNVVNVGTAIENPYAFNNTLILNRLQEASTEENMFGVMIADPGGLIPKSVGYRELAQPFVMFVDSYGFVRLIMQGRVRDISNDSINSTMGVIAEMWQWDESEMDIMPTAVMLLINLVREQAYDPEERKIPMPETALTVAPSWGYPPVIPETIYIPELDQNYVSF